MYSSKLNGCHGFLPHLYTLCISFRFGGGGLLHVKTYRDVPSKWVGSLQEISRHGTHGKISMFLIFNIFQSLQENFENLCVFLAKSQEIGTYFQKNPSMGAYFFLKNYPQTCVCCVEFIQLLDLSRSNFGHRYVLWEVLVLCRLEGGDPNLTNPKPNP